MCVNTRLSNRNGEEKRKEKKRMNLLGGGGDISFGYEKYFICLNRYVIDKCSVIHTQEQLSRSDAYSKVLATNILPMAT